MVWDRLTEDEKTRLSALRRESGFYGVLRPRTGASGQGRHRGGTYKAVDRDTALLLLGLREPGPLPFFVRERLGHESVASMVRGLLLDGVLELEHEGRFCSGPEVLDLFGMAERKRADSRLGRLTERALAWAIEMPPRYGSNRLALRLYAYNSLPLTDSWYRLGDRSAVARFLGLDPGGSAARSVRRSWQPIEPENGRGVGWISYRSRGGVATEGEKEKGRYKLYYSPLPEQLPELMPMLLDRLAPHARGLKVGANGVGLLRPDKCVAYFDRRENLQKAIDALQDASNGVRAQGVPFTAGLDGAGLLSWGIDPPDTENPLPWQQRESWRWWLVKRWVAALDVARDREPEGEPETLLRYTLERLRLRGVDVERWIPSRVGG